MTSVWMGWRGAVLVAAAVARRGAAEEAADFAEPVSDYEPQQGDAAWHNEHKEAPHHGGNPLVLELKLGSFGGNLIEESTHKSERIIRIRLRPDWSGEATAKRIRRFAEVATSGISGGRYEFYRAEGWGVLQGEMSNPGLPWAEHNERGPCPEDADASIYEDRKCYDHDPDCGCHGPIFEYGMVGWAGGAGSGPHFFIYTGKQPAMQWAHDHTVFGEVIDRPSLNLIRKMLLLPIRNEAGMSMLGKRIPFTVGLMDRFAAARFVSETHGTSGYRIHDRHQYELNNKHDGL